MVQTLSRCRSCGLPKQLPETMEWLPGGIIVFKRLREVRLAIIDKDLYDRFHAALSHKEKGEDDPVFEIQKEATRYIAGRVLKGVRARIIRYNVVMKRALEAMERYSLLLGMGRIEVERIKIEAGGSLLIKMPFNPHLLSAGIMGVIEQIEGRAYARRLSRTADDEYKLIMDVCEGDDYKKVDFEDMGLLQTAAVEGEGLERCRQCGAPTDLDTYSWDEIYGVIEDTRGNVRLAFIPTYMLSAVRRAAGHGEKEVAEAMRDAVYSSTMERLAREGGPASIGGLLDEISVKGWGQATALEAGESRWRLIMENPLDTSLIAGWLRAIYYFDKKREPEISVSEEVSRAEFLLE